MTDNDDSLRFGDVSGSGQGGAAKPMSDQLIEWFVTLFLGLVFLYILIEVADSLFNIPLV